jgi:phenylalanyl-tRNA synthetase beta subunit
VTDSIREQVAQAGYNEVLTWVLLSFDDNYRFMQPKDVEGITIDLKELAKGSEGGSQLLEKPLVIHPLLASPKAITLSNPKSLDFQLVRTTLLPGLLKALANNQGQVELPIRLFECGDVGFQDTTTDVGARNQRRIAAIYCDARSGFEVIQGLLDRIMEINNVRFGPSVLEYRANRARMAEKKKAAEAAEKKRAAAALAAGKAAKPPKGGAAPAAASASVAAAAAAAPASVAAAPAPVEEEEAEWSIGDTFTLRPSSHPSFFPGRRADILLHRVSAPKGAEPIVLGQFGILHPDVMSQFGIPFVCSAVEINVEHFL